MEQMQTVLDSLATNMLGKGLKAPDVHYVIRSNTKGYFYFTWINDADQCQSKFIHQESDLDELILNAHRFVRNIPPKAERDLATYRKAVADAIDLGNKLGIEAAQINPLRVAMEKLSSNILEDHSGGEPEF